MKKLTFSLIVACIVFLCSCQRIKKSVSVYTEPPEVYGTDVVLKGYVSADNLLITEIGICYDVSPEPTIDGNHMKAREGAGQFQCIIKNLEPSRKYYYRVYTCYNSNITYGDNQEFQTGKSSVTLPIDSSTIVGTWYVLGGIRDNHTYVIAETDCHIFRGGDSLNYSNVFINPDWSGWMTYGVWSLSSDTISTIELLWGELDSNQNIIGADIISKTKDWIVKTIKQSSDGEKYMEVSGVWEPIGEAPCESIILKYHSDKVNVQSIQSFPDKEEELMKCADFFPIHNVIKISTKR